MLLLSSEIKFVTPSYTSCMLRAQRYCFSSCIKVDMQSRGFFLVQFLFIFTSTWDSSVWWQLKAGEKTAMTVVRCFEMESCLGTSLHGWMALEALLCDKRRHRNRGHLEALHLFSFLSLKRICAPLGGLVLQSSEKRAHPESTSKAIQ